VRKRNKILIYKKKLELLNFFYKYSGKKEKKKEDNKSSIEYNE
jgi:hypothetical protein